MAQMVLKGRAVDYYIVYINQGILPEMLCEYLLHGSLEDWGPIPPTKRHPQELVEPTMCPEGSFILGVRFEL